MSKKINSAVTLFRPGSRTGFTIQHLSTSKKLPSSIRSLHNAIRELLTSSLPDFPASPSASQESSEGKMIPVTAGRKPLKPFASYDHATHSWRTSQVSLLTNTLDEYSETWPRAGMMQNGQCWELTMSALPTLEKGSGCWLTPQAQDAKHSGYAPADKDRNLLSVQVVRWPTPRAQDGEKMGTGSLGDKKVIWPTPDAQVMDWYNKSLSPGAAMRPTLARAVKLFPTPRGVDGERGASKKRKGTNQASLKDEVGGTLNPPWVEWLMNWPIGSTSLQPMEKKNYDEWQRKTMQSVWWKNDPSEVEERQARQHMEESEVLQHQVLRKSECAEKSKDANPESATPENDTSNRMFNVQIKGEGAEASHRGTCDNTLSEMPYSNTHERWNMGQVPRVATGVKDRVPRLKALGNGQVPAVVVEAWKRLIGEL